MDGAWLVQPLLDAGSSKKQAAFAGSVRWGDMQDGGADGLDPSLPWEAWWLG